MLSFATMGGSRDRSYAFFALAFMALVGTALIIILPGSPEQDSDYHFLMARTAWSEPSYFVNVWARPLFTTVMAPAALFGLPVARFLALAIGLALAWQTYRLACDLRLNRPWLVILILLGQPTFFELFTDLFTEPLFALVFVLALRLHFAGRTRLGLLTASFLPLARPEGFFLCLCWIIWGAEVGEKSSCRSKTLRRLSTIFILGSGVAAWWLAALMITGDPLFILHNWPKTWHQDMYGRGTIFSYSERALEFTGYLLVLPFLLGFCLRLGSKRWLPITCSFLVLFLLHSVFRLYGLFGEAGYPRYMVSVSPAVTLLILEGWNALARNRFPRSLSRFIGFAVLVLSLFLSFFYLDTITWARDPIAINEMANWLRQNPQQFTRLIWSNARMCTVLGMNLKNSPPLPDRESSVALLEAASPGTLVFWDDHLGPEWFGLTSNQIEKSGFQLLRRKHYSLSSPVFAKPYPVLPGFLTSQLASREIELSLWRKP